VKDNIEKFIQNGLYENPKKMRKEIFLINFIPIGGIIAGIIFNNQYIVFSILITLILLISFISTIIFTKNVTIANTVKTGIFINIPTACNYLLLSMFMYTRLWGFNLGIFLLLIPLGYVSKLTINRINKNIENKKYKYVKIVKIASASLFYTGGVGSVYYILKSLDLSISQDVVTLLLMIFSLLFSTLFVLLGTCDIVKLYYIKKMPK